MAAWNWGLPGVRSLPEAADMEICPWLLGSGKSLTPWERMHREKATALAWLDDDALTPEALGAVVVAPALATPGPPDPPPQAAATSAKATMATAGVPAVAHVRHLLRAGDWATAPTSMFGCIDGSPWQVDGRGLLGE
jgi:hypothetical protein